VLAFGLKSQSTWVAEQVNNQTDKVIVALLVSVRAAAAYEIASRVANAVKAVGVLTVSAIIPTATAEIIRRGTTVIHEYYGRYTTRAISIAFPICVAAAITAPYLFVAWLGEVPHGTLVVMIVLTGAHFVSLTSGVASTVSIAAGDPGLVATNAVLVAAVNLALTAALAPIFGLWGVLAGTFGAITAGSLLFVARFQRKWRIEPRAFSRAVALPASLALGLAVPIVAVEIVLDSAPESRLPAGAVTLAVATAYLVPYWVLASRTGILPAQLAYGAVLGRLRRRTHAPAAPDPLHNGSALPGGSADGSDSEPGAQAGDSAASISGR
jgi:O-antigen/teichoic acid export membrane protein